MKNLSTTLLFTIALLLLFSCQQEIKPSKERLEEVPYTSVENNQEKKFHLYIPKGYDSDDVKDWPVILFLHGHGERGNGQDDLGFTLAHGPLFEAWVQRKDIPFLIIGPQLPLYGFDTLGIPYLTDRKIEDAPKRLAEGTPPRSPKFGTNQPMNGSLSDSIFNSEPTGPRMGWNTVEKDLIDMLDIVKEKYRVDESRIYLSGLSYGGFGAWYMASKYPDIWAAVNPIVGWGHPDLMEPIVKAKTPIWCFAGGRDPVVKVQYFYPGLNKLETLGHKDIRFTVEEDMGHDVWTRVYAGDDIYNWFLNYKKD